MTEEKENVNALENLNEEQRATGVEYLWAQNFWVPVLMIAIAIGIQFLGLSVWTVAIDLVLIGLAVFYIRYLYRHIPANIKW
jgi:Flp pilus assembly protein TadB